MDYDLHAINVLKFNMSEPATVATLQKELRQLADPKRAEASAWFFKTGKGQYGEGDKFIGVTVPQLRKVAKRYTHLSLSEVHALLANPIHEFRLIAMHILVYQFQKADSTLQTQIYSFYIKHAKRINNWDLVDSSAPYIVGPYLLHTSRNVLYTLAKSRNLWERRIAIIATAHFIKHNQFKDTLAIAEILIQDTHDLIHKAVGWMLREVGNRDREAEEKFLKKHYKNMPRTMLRYAIEKFPPTRRQQYLRGTI